MRAASLANRGVAYTGVVRLHDMPRWHWVVAGDFGIVDPAQPGWEVTVIDAA